MDGEAYDHLFKLLMIGDAGVGKSSVLLRFTDGTFDDQQPPTIGVDFKVAMLNVGGRRIKATIWDTAGQERFRTLTSAYYRGAQGVMLVYDVTRRSTFEHLSSWLEEMDNYCTGGAKSVAKLLVGNKIDLEDRREVPFSDGEAWARSKGMLFMETSAKSQAGVAQVFEELVEKILENPVLLAGTTPARKPGEAPRGGSTGGAAGGGGGRAGGESVTLGGGSGGAGAGEEGKGAGLCC